MTELITSTLSDFTVSIEIIIDDTESTGPLFRFVIQ